MTLLSDWAESPPPTYEYITALHTPPDLLQCAMKNCCFSCNDVDSVEYQKLILIWMWKQMLSWNKRQERNCANLMYNSCTFLFGETVKTTLFSSVNCFLRHSAPYFDSWCIYWYWKQHVTVHVTSVQVLFQLMPISTMGKDSPCIQHSMASTSHCLIYGSDKLRKSFESI